MQKKGMLPKTETNDDQSVISANLEQSKQVKDETSMNSLLNKTLGTGNLCFFNCNLLLSFPWPTLFNHLPTCSLVWSCLNLKEITPASPKLLAWSTYLNNNISMIDLETMQSYGNFIGAQIKQGSSHLICQQLTLDIRA